jgi:hypothetical protein
MGVILAERPGAGRLGAGFIDGDHLLLAVVSWSLAQ